MDLDYVFATDFCSYFLILLCYFSGSHRLKKLKIDVKYALSLNYYYTYVCVYYLLLHY